MLVKFLIANLYFLIIIQAVNIETVGAYERFADAYDLETRTFWDKFPSSVINEFTKQLRGTRVVDLGSGPGRDALILAAQGLDMVCLDASIAMCRKTASLGFPTICADIENLAISPGSFDGVWAYTSLIHIPKGNLPAALDGVRDILTHEGVLGLGMMEGDFEGLKESPSMPGAHRYFTYYTEAELSNYLVNSGFAVLIIERFSIGRNTYLNVVCKKV